MSEALLEARGITKVFRRGREEVWALRGVDLEVGPGEMIAIVGPSGAGKSTLLHILGTLERPSSGVLRYGGRRLDDMEEDALSELRNREVGFVFQFHYLLPEFTALENVMIPCLIGGLSFGEARRRAREILERVGLGGRLEHRPGELSGGEQQRVAVARALVMGPKLLFADEPTGNLDSKTGEDLIGLLEDLNRSLGTAVVCVTHNEVLAGRFPRRLRMEDGRIVGGL